MARVRIVKLPKALSGLEIKMQPGLYGTNGNRQFNKSAHLEAGKISQHPIEVRDTLQPVAREDANLEAEKGETAVLNMGGIPAHFKIGGKRHSQGGTPLNLPDNSFIFSDTAKMKIKDPNVLAQFGMKPKRGGYTPAEIAKKYDINKFRKVLADPNTEDIERKTAEMMIANYNEKLAKLALAQESVKGFPQGIPVIAMPYIENMEMNPATFLPDQAQEQLEEGSSPDADMGTSRYGSQVISKWNTKKYGGLPKAQFGTPSFDEFKNKVTNPGEEYSSKRPGMYQQVQDAMQSIPKKDYVKKGWSGDPQAEESWAQQNQATYDLYKEAMLMPEKNPEQVAKKKQKLLDASAKIETGLAFESMPRMFSKTEDLKQILGEEFLRLDNPEEYKKKYLKEDQKKQNYDQTIKQDKINADKVSELYRYYLKRKDDPTLTAGDRKDAENELARLYKYHADYKKAYPRLRMYEAPKAALVAKDINEPATPGIMYSPTEAGQITKDYAKVFENADIYFPSKQELAKMSPAEQAKWKEIDKKIHYRSDKTYDADEASAVSPAIPSDTTIFAKDLGKIKKEDLDRLLAEEEAGRKIIYKEEDGGSILLPKAQKGKSLLKEEAARRAKGSGSKSQPATKVVVSEIDPYGGYSEDELAELLEDPSILRKSKVSGYQKKGSGSYGKGVTVEEFMARNPEYIKAFESTHGRKFDPNTDSETFQKDYNKHVEELAYKRALDAGYDEVKAKSLSKRFAETQGFKAGVKEGTGDPRGIDKKFGEYTSSRFEPIFKSIKKPEPEKKADITLTKEENTPADRGPVERHPPVDLGQGTYAPWWLQDIVKISGAAADKARVKRYLPWQATPEVRLPEATFYDPTRELAANAEQANIQTQGLAAFTGPQALSARSSAIQGQAAKNAADIMARYNNMNVQLANQLNQERTSIMNTAAQQKAALDTQLFDKYTIANQQFDNAKNLARQSLRQSYIDAITNRAKTQALNTLYPNFYTDPISGGFVQKTGYASINPTQPGSDELDKIEKIIKRFPGTTFKEAQDYVRKGKGSDDENDVSGYYKAQGYTE